MTTEYKTIEQLHELLVQGELTAVELVESLYERVQELDEKVGAFLTLDKESALEQARTIDEQGIDPNNPLSGIPIGIKDNIVTKEGTTSAASKMLEGFQSVYDATAIKKLKEAGMISFGKLNMDEFAMGGSTENSAYQLTRNPWNLDKVPGGSSGGSAAAVAAGLVPAALGTDTGGSIRQPAAYNGVVGLKPTYGRVSRYGLIAFGSSLDQIGPLTRTVRDNALVLNALSGYDEKDSTSSPRETEDFTRKIGESIKGKTIGVPKELLNQSHAKNDIIDTVKAAIKVYEELGATIKEVSLEHAKYGVAAYYILSSSEASSNLQRFDGIHYGYRNEEAESLEEVYVKSRSEGFGDEVKRRILLGTFSLSSGYYDAYFEKAARARTLIIEDFKKAFSDVDVILTPASLTEAYTIGKRVKDPVKMYKADEMTVTVNLAGIPAISIPCGFINEMPVGLQLIGKHFDEATLYQFAAAFEATTDYHQQLPTFKGGE
ncbi:Asp-tRNA(Asn)/Glu-tRNA(Gln) amidotransferase subunit GatA [Dolosigranulum pigrum]|uniref:Asp-tRNA(Asn)/Glu-tRNA(Gln) amidotransferase subunit GatA n=1 Tax=Dolosigranulum pigrum TaxID=29394 RepID=UPI00191AE732|nr:Asp-tRNA(Asn)/Glu-tRNA(Gln) amidotransferase subunit GatA [Dolosigranulum pigrum]